MNRLIQGRAEWVSEVTHEDKAALWTIQSSGLCMIRELVGTPDRRHWREKGAIVLPWDVLLKIADAVQAAKGE